MDRNIITASILMLISETLLAIDDGFQHQHSRDKQSVDWHEQSTAVRLPPPFGDVIVTISKGGDELEAIQINVRGDEIEVPKQLLNGISPIREQGIAYSRVDFEDDGQIEEFQLAVEFGAPEVVQVPEFPGCPAPCSISLWDTAIFTVNVDYEVTRETIETEDIRPPESAY